MLEEALKEERLELERCGDTALLTALEKGADESGPTGAMRAMAEELAKRASQSYVEPFNIAAAFAKAMLVDETLFWLEKAVKNGSFEMHYMAFWPHLDFLRKNDRYQTLMNRVYGDKAAAIRKLAPA